MAAERNATGSRADAAEAHQPTVTADAFEPGVSDSVASLVETHRRAAARLLAEGKPTHALGELVRASRAVPMTPRLAAHLVSVSMRAAAEPAAITLLQTGLEDAEGEVRTGIRRQLVRLFRKLREWERAREHLVLVLAERSHDLRARRVLNALLEVEERWDELDASLEKETREALKRGALTRASRATLHRARVSERLGNHPRASLRYAQAAQYLEQANAPDAAFDLRLLWIRSLKQSDAPPRALEEAAQTFLAAGARAQQSDRAHALLAALGLEAPPAPGAKAKGRSNTQRELLAAAEAAEAKGRNPEAAALFQAAVAEGPDPKTLRRLEAHYVARRAWRDLAQLYKDRIAATSAKEERSELLGRLAELLEDELGDPEGASQAYAEIVRLTGDDAALREQVRLLSARQDQSGVRRAFDTAVDAAGTSHSRSKALVARGEARLRKKDLERARQDFEAALEVDGANLAALAGRAEAAANLGDGEPTRAFAQAMKAAPRRFPGRAALCRRLALLAQAKADDPAVAKWAWTELLSESPDDEQAADEIATLARQTNDDFTLEDALLRVLKREPRGHKARRARLDLVALLERGGRADEALAALRDAVRFEPGHKEAWLLLAQRLETRKQHGECAWALEQAATSTEDDRERAATWLRLSRFTREHLGDAQKAAVYERRAKKIEEDLGESSFTTPISGPVTIPAPPAAAPSSEPTPTEVPDAAAPTEYEMPAVTGAEVEDLADALSGVEVDDQSGSALRPLELPWEEGPEPSDLLEVTTGDLLIDEAAAAEEAAPLQWDAPPGRLDPAPGPQKLPVPVPLGEAKVAATPSLPTPMVTKLREERARLLERVRADPLDPDGYHRLAGYFEDVGDASRSALMAEIGAALDGDPHAAPLPPRLILNATDRAGLRHPLLRGEAGELLALCGVALCRAFPVRGRDAGSREEFRMDGGRGAPGAAEALLASVRILGLRAPDVYLAEDNGPPFSLVHGALGPRVLVGRLAVKRELPAGELRFFAGRALFTQNPDLLALRNLKKDALNRGLQVLAQVVKRGKNLSAEARALREGLSPRAQPRIAELLTSLGRELPLVTLIEAARHSANRAGLVVAGAVAPALGALRAKKALKSEVVELVRFAASERYLQLRSRRLG